MNGETTFKQPSDPGRMQAIVRRLPAAQQEVIDRLKNGEKLKWYGNAGPEISGRPLWPQKRTVETMLRKGLLIWGDYLNETQKQFGIRPLILPPNEKSQDAGATE